MTDDELLEFIRSRKRSVGSHEVAKHLNGVERLLADGRILRSVSTGSVSYYHYNTSEPIGAFHVGDRVRYARSPTSSVYKTGQIVGIFRNKALIYDGGHSGTDVVLPYRLEKI